MDAIFLVGSFGDTWFSARTLGLILWGGLAVLSVALLVLTRTRWGQAQPLSKCVALSVFAHVLLMGYAYGTKLIFDVTPGLQEEVVQMAVISAIQDEQFTPGPADALQPWDDLASDAASPPELEAPDRVLTTIQERTTEISVTRPDVESPLAPRDIETPERQRPLPAATVVAPPLMPAKIPEVEVVPTNNDRTVIATPNISPATSGPELPRAVDRNSRPPEAAETTGHEDQGPDDGQIQRLVDVPIKVDSARSIRDTFDQTAAADNLADAGNNAESIIVNRDRTPAPIVASRVTPTPLVEVSSRRRPGDGLPVPRLYQLRNPENRLRVAQQFGGNTRTEGAVDNALRWLATAQSTNGRWDANQFGGGAESQTLGHDRQAAGTDADTGITGLALLAFLAAGHTHLDGAYRENVQHGLEFLLRSQADNGNLYGDARLFARMYCHGIAALALGEAYVMTGDHRLMPFLLKATQYTRASQHSALGGWRYQPGDVGDMSQFGWQVMSLRSAELAGIEIPTATRDGMVRFLRHASSGQHGGLAAYRVGERPSPTMTAEALACRYFLRLPTSTATVDEATDLIQLELPGTGQVNLYYWYYATMALFHGQDPGWQRWNEALQDELLGSQRRSGQFDGSWDPDCVWGGYGGRVYSTAMATLCLEVYYRYLPLFDEAANP